MRSLSRPGLSASSIPDDPEPQGTPGRVVLGNRALVVVEDVIYVSIAVLLAVAAGVVLVRAGIELFTTIGEDDPNGLVSLLDSLLLVFIFVELLYAVRTTLKERQILAEPFLIAGILASIKEIIVLSVTAADDYISKGPEFARAMVEIGILAVTVLLLAGTAVLLRKKEKEPEETGSGAETRDAGPPT
jgi:uncharacterized membrane protein (DUF373 family)